jgi:hypothetical protein
MFSVSAGARIEKREPNAYLTLLATSVPPVTATDTAGVITIEF